MLCRLSRRNDVAQDGKVDAETVVHRNVDLLTVGGIRSQHRPQGCPLQGGLQRQRAATDPRWQAATGQWPFELYSTTSFWLRKHFYDSFIALLLFFNVKINGRKSCLTDSDLLEVLNT